jgi:hypothetical protein
LVIKSLINRKARTGLFLAGSTGLLVAACFSKFAVADLHNLVDSVSYHFSRSSFSLKMFWVIKLRLTDEVIIERLGVKTISKYIRNVLRWVFKIKKFLVLVKWFTLARFQHTSGNLKNSCLQSIYQKMRDINSDLSKIVTFSLSGIQFTSRFKYLPDL